MIISDQKHIFCLCVSGSVTLTFMSGSNHPDGNVGNNNHRHSKVPAWAPSRTQRTAFIHQVSGLRDSFHVGESIQIHQSSCLKRSSGQSCSSFFHFRMDRSVILMWHLQNWMGQSLKVGVSGFLLTIRPALLAQISASWWRDCLFLPLTLIIRHNNQSIVMTMWCYLAAARLVSESLKAVAGWLAGPSKNLKSSKYSISNEEQGRHSRTSCWSRLQTCKGCKTPCTEQQNTQQEIIEVCLIKRIRKGRLLITFSIYPPLLHSDVSCSLNQMLEKSLFLGTGGNKIPNIEHGKKHSNPDFFHLLRKWRINVA